MKATSVKKYNLGILQYWLDYELAGSALLVMSYIYFVTFYLVILAAVALIPLLLKVLFEQKRYGWMASFFLFIILPPLFIYLFLGDWYWTIIAAYISIATFYVYLVFLRIYIPRWPD